MELINGALVLASLAVLVAAVVMVIRGEIVNRRREREMLEVLVRLRGAAEALNSAARRLDDLS